jgi:hypothetical protein
MVRSFDDAMAFSAGGRFAVGTPRYMPQPWQPLAAAVVGLAYPLVVLVVVRRKTVDEYFRPIE